MNRQIKFRGKRVDNGEWVYGNYFHVIKNGEILHIIGVGLVNNKGIGWQVKPATISQLIGETDKNGVEIFENDILDNPKFGKKICLYKGREFSFRSLEKKWPNLSDGYDWQRHFYVGDAEVIGNIHDNPELLNQ